jgi:mono/diheme cytochrome c family protein
MIPALKERNPMGQGWGKRLAKITGYIILGLLTVAALILSFTIGWTPIVGARKRPLTSRKFEVTTDRLQRGEYLAHGVLLCTYCHSSYDQKTDPPVLLFKEGAGKVLIEDGSLRVAAPNITSDAETGIGKWSDDAIARAIREGIAFDGRSLFPAMPYGHFRHLSDEDVASVVVFIRSLPPARSELPPNKIPFALTRILQTLPQPITEVVAGPNMSTPVKYGAYLAEMANCIECHTPVNARHEPIPGMEMAGGNPESGGVMSANLTPDASGIVYYDEALFIETMRTGFVHARKLSSAMPWWVYRNMTDADLKAVFAYLRTLKPVHHLVDNTEPPTQCKLCGQKHGLGDHN